MLLSLLDFFISPAAAADIASASTAPQNSNISLLIMFIIFFSFIYLAVWRPQNKRLREQQALLASLAPGDEVITVGGLVGSIVKLEQSYAKIAVAEAVELMIQKSSVASVLPKGSLRSLQ